MYLVFPFIILSVAFLIKMYVKCIKVSKMRSHITFLFPFVFLVFSLFIFFGWNDVLPKNRKMLRKRHFASGNMYSTHTHTQIHTRTSPWWQWWGYKKRRSETQSLMKHYAWYFLGILWARFLIASYKDNTMVNWGGMRGVPMDFFLVRV